MKAFIPEQRRNLEIGELEIMKGRGSRQVWFYVTNVDDAKTLVRLGRGHCFPTGVTRNNGEPDLSTDFYIQEEIQSS